MWCWVFSFSSIPTGSSQGWFGTVNSLNIGFVDWNLFDGYQTAGLIGRALLWGTQPFLIMLLVQRQLLQRTTKASLKFFWIYLGALVGGCW